MDDVTRALIAAQVETRAHLWTPADAVVFTPSVLSTSFGDGRALFRVTTINNRPRWWLVRGDSHWSESNDPATGYEPFIDHADEIITALAEEFGGLPLMLCEDDEYINHETGEIIDPADLTYPQVDDRIGTSWQQIDWPDLDAVAMTPHPHLPNIRLLAASETVAG